MSNVGLDDCYSQLDICFCLFSEAIYTVFAQALEQLNSG